MEARNKSEHYKRSRGYTPYWKEPTLKLILRNIRRTLVYAVFLLVAYGVGLLFIWLKLQQIRQEGLY
jgi:hypothetical protein